MAWLKLHVRHGAALPLVLAATVWMGGETWAERSVSRVHRMLDAYEQGDPRTVGAEWEAVTNYESFRFEFPRDADKWIRSKPEGRARDARRRLATVFSLELGHATLQTPGWTHVRRIVEWGCEQIRSGPPTPFERTWLLAADALMQGDVDPSFGEPHARHSQQRFPDEPRFRLAEAVARRQARLPANKPGTSTLQLVYGQGPVRRDLSARRVRETLDGLSALADDPVVGAEARVHLGMLYLHLGRLTDALTQLRAASRAHADSSVTYLAYLLSARVLELQQDPASAIRAYRSALAIRPLAASGLSALAALLFLSDHREEAADLYARMVTTSPPAPDPWREFGFGSYRFWPDYIAQLRREVGR